MNAHFTRRVLRSNGKPPGNFRLAATHGRRSKRCLKNDLEAVS
jgi:hypothetical protein